MKCTMTFTKQEFLLAMSRTFFQNTDKIMAKSLLIDGYKEMDQSVEIEFDDEEEVAKQYSTRPILPPPPKDQAPEIPQSTDPIFSPRTSSDFDIPF